MWPLLPLPFKLRLPTKCEVAIAGAAAVVLLFCSWLRRGEKIASLEAALAAKPMIEEKVREVRVEGPVWVVEKIVKTADGACSIERTTDRGPVTTEREAEHQERPACPAYAPRTWAIGGALDLRSRDRGSVGVSKSFGDLSLGLSHGVGADARLGDISAGVSLKVF